MWSCKPCHRGKSINQASVKCQQVRVLCFRRGDKHRVVGRMVRSDRQFQCPGHQISRWKTDIHQCMCIQQSCLGSTWVKPAVADLLPRYVGKFGEQEIRDRDLSFPLQQT